MKKLLSLSLTLLCLASPIFAETYVLDLEKSISIAKEKSISMLILRQSVKMSEYNLKSATSRLKTHVNLELYTPNYAKAIKRYEDSEGVSYTGVNLVNYNSQLFINQPLMTDGSISIISRLENDENILSNQRDTRLNTYLQLSQPLNSIWGYNEIKNVLKEANLQYEQYRKTLKREELNLVYDVSNNFFSLLNSQKREEIAKSNLERQKEAYSIAKNKFEAGLIKEVEALQMEVDLSEAQNNYDLSIVNQSSAKNQLKQLIGLEMNDSIIIDSNLDYKVVVVDPEKALEMAMKNRLEIREKEIQIERNKIDIQNNKARGMVKGDLIASFGLDGAMRDKRDVPFTKTLNSTYNNLTNGANSYTVGLKVSIPILDWGENRSRVNAAKAALQQSIYSQEENKRNIEREIRNLVSDLNSNLKRLQLLEKSVVVAEKSFEITRQRFSDGDIDSQAMALERERLNNAYNSHLNAYIDYEMKLADLMRKTFFDFQRDLSIN